MTKKQTEERWPEPVYLTADHAINMTLRDYFAAKVVQAMISSPHCDKEFNATHKVKTAYAVADEMLKARGQI